jgi:hypothetical protein
VWTFLKIEIRILVGSPYRVWSREFHFRLLVLENPLPFGALFKGDLTVMIKFYK